MPPKIASRSGAARAALNAILAKKNPHAFQSLDVYVDTMFCVDRFRELYKLLPSRELDRALAEEMENYRAGEKTLHKDKSLVELIIRLLKGYVKGAVNDSNYQEQLHSFIDRKFCQVAEKRNPLGADPSTSNVHALPTEVKLWLLRFLLEMRTSRSDSETIDEFRDAEQLRAVELGSDSAGNSYHYFHDFRIFARLKKPAKYESAVECKFLRGAAWEAVFSTVASGASAQWVIVAEAVDSWTALQDALKQAGEKKLLAEVASLYDAEYDMFKLEIAKQQKIEAEQRAAKEKAEFAAMRELGMVRTSGRLQVKEAERRKREEEERRRDAEQRRAVLEAVRNGDISAADAKEMEPDLPKAMSREERRLLREARVAELEARGSSEPGGIYSHGPFTASCSATPQTVSEATSAAASTAGSDDGEPPAAKRLRDEEGDVEMAETNGCGHDGQKENGAASRTPPAQPCPPPPQHFSHPHLTVKGSQLLPAPALPTNGLVPREACEQPQLWHEEQHELESAQYRKEVMCAERFYSEELRHIFGKYRTSGQLSEHARVVVERSLLQIVTGKDEAKSRSHVMVIVGKMVGSVLDEFKQPEDHSLACEIVEFMRDSWPAVYSRPIPSDKHFHYKIGELSDACEASAARADSLRTFL